MATVGELGGKRLKALGRRPVAGGDHHHGVGQLDDLLDTLDRHCGGLVDGLQHAATYRSRRDRGDAHVGEREVDPVDCRAIDLCGNVAPGHRLADQLPLVAGFQHRITGERTLCRPRRQLAIAQRLARFGVGDNAVGRGEFALRHAQPIGGFRQQCSAHRRASAAHRDLASEADRRGAAGDHQRHRARHHADHRVRDQARQRLARHRRQKALGERGVGEGEVGRGLLDRDLAPVSVKLVRQHLRERRVRALAEVDMRREDGDGVVLGDGHDAAEGGLALSADQGIALGLYAAVGPPHSEDAAAHHKCGPGKENAALDALALWFFSRGSGFGQIEIGVRIVGHHAAPSAAAAAPVAARMALRMRG